MIQQYFKLQKRIYEMFGYTGGEMMLCDSTRHNWIEHNGRVYSSPDEMTPELIETGKSLYDSYPDRQWSADGYTMILMDSQTSSGRVLVIYDDAKRIESPTETQLDALDDW